MAERIFDENTYDGANFSLSPNSIISEIVDRAISDEHLESSDDDVRQVFLSILLKTELDIREKKSAIVDFIAAGIETVFWIKSNILSISYFYSIYQLANTLSFLLYYTSLRPETHDRIRMEFPVVGEVRPEHVSTGTFTKACLQETYRICPTAFCLARMLEEDTTLSGYDLKAGVS